MLYWTIQLNTMKNLQNTLNKLKNKWKFITATTLLAILASIGITFAIPATYKTHTELLVVQKQADWAEDAYSASQSAERVATVLAQVVPSSAFLDRVLDSGFNIKDNFNNDPEERKEDWQNTVEVSVIKNTGILEIDIFSTDKEQTKQITYAISNILMNKGEIYHGGGDRIEIRMFEKPITSNKPAYPNMSVDIAIGAILGLMLGAGIVVLRKEKEITKTEVKQDNFSIDNYSLLR